jgi:MFS family permease
LSIDPSSSSRPKFTITQWLVLVVAAIGFLFDTYELLMLPIIARPALAEVLQVPQNSPLVLEWVGRLLWLAAICGGVFGLLGGILIDRLGRKRVMVGSIFLYSLSPVCAAFSTDVYMLVFFRCTTFIGVCVEFVAAITWLAELFPDKRTRELAIGWTQAFASVGGIFVTVAYDLIKDNAASLPALPLPEPFNPHADWRYTLLTGLIPGALILLLMPFVPESQVWLERKRNGTLKRPRFSEIFAPSLLRITIVSTVLSACGYAAAFGALQLTPSQVVPGLPQFKDDQKQLAPLRKDAKILNENLLKTEAGSDERKDLQKQIGALRKQMIPLEKPTLDQGAKTQFWQEIGGLTGRILLAILLVVVASRRQLLRMFQIPGLILFPLTYYFLYQQQQDFFIFGIFLCGLVTVAQFSYFGEYLPKVYPVHLRGTGGAFATNVGGRMIGTSGAYLTTSLIAPAIAGAGVAALPIHVATAAAITGGSVYLIGLVASFFLPEPPKDGE